jgi:hypothetical protein
MSTDSAVLLFQEPLALSCGAEGDYRWTVGANGVAAPLLIQVMILSSILLARRPAGSGSLICADAGSGSRSRPHS